MDHKSLSTVVYLLSMYQATLCLHILNDVEVKKETECSDNNNNTRLLYDSIVGSTMQSLVLDMLPVNSIPHPSSLPK